MGGVWIGIVRRTYASDGDMEIPNQGCIVIHNFSLLYQTWILPC